MNINQISRPERTQNVSFDTYLTIFSTFLTHRLPDNRDLKNVDSEVINDIANLALACSVIVTDTWSVTTRQQSSDQNLRRTGS